MGRVSPGPRGDGRREWSARMEATLGCASPPGPWRPADRVRRVAWWPVGRGRRGGSSGGPWGVWGGSSGGPEAGGDSADKACVRRVRRMSQGHPVNHPVG
ncbi:hypothetical protein FRAAL3978 [Frankia alni ACN14a]|uniref:Uncharacterized protein n=1 Tax=Frankia alni (strain DSM 45986 / CECT 9034 / ACN14a) TaxID=326424 RepID=Q0RIP7_FRAAA|nr:hypothetical protein FRAAL3978 [Frankia alni ACN14a]